MDLAGFPGGSEDKASVCIVGDLGSIPQSGRSPGEGNGKPLQSTCLENSMDGGAWLATIHGIAKSCTRLRSFTSHETGSLPLLTVRSSDSTFHLIMVKTGLTSTFIEYSPLLSLLRKWYRVCTLGVSLYGSTCAGKCVILKLQIRVIWQNQNIPLMKAG